MLVPIVLPIIGYSLLSLLISYAAVRLYRSRASYSHILPTSLRPSKSTTSWDWHKSLSWSRSPLKKKTKPSKHLSIDLLPTTGLPPPPTALPSTPPFPLVDLSSASIPRTPSPSPPVSFYNKQIQSLQPTSFPRPPSPHALLATTSPQKSPRRSRSLGGVPVRRLSGGASGLRNVQFLDLDMEMQEMNRGTSREHLLIDFSSSGSSDELDALRKENEEEGVGSRRISPASSDIGVLPSHRLPSLFHDADVPLVNLDLAPGRKVVQLVDLDDVEDVKQKEDAWKWFEPPLPTKLHFTPLDSTPALISKSISEPLPVSLPLSEGKLIDLHSGPEEEDEHVLVDLHVHQDDNDNVPQPEFIHVHRTHVDLNAVVDDDPFITKSAVDVRPLDEFPTVKSSLEGRRSLDSLMKAVDITTPVESLESSLRGVDRHPLEEAYEEKVLKNVEEDPAMKFEEQVANEHEHEHDELYDHHDDYTYVYDIHHDQPSLEGESSSVPAQAAAVPMWNWDDPWNGVVNEEEVKEEQGEEVVGEREEVEEERGEEVDLMEVSEMEVGLGVEQDTSSGFERSLEEVPKDEDSCVSETEAGLQVEQVLSDLKLPTERSLEVPEDEESYPDPDYLPLPELLLSPATETPLILVENELPNGVPEVDEIQTEVQEQQQPTKDDYERNPRRVAAQMPTPPASPPPPSPLRVRGLGLGGMRSGPPSPRSIGGLLPAVSSVPLSMTSPKLAPLLVLTPPNTSSPSPTMEVLKVSQGDKENEVPNNNNNNMAGRPLWSIRADDAPALGLAASSLSLSVSTSVSTSAGGTSPVGVSPRMRRRVLGDVTSAVENGEKEEKPVQVKEEKEVKKEDVLKEEKDEEEDDDDESSLPGAFPESASSSDTNTIIIAPTITIAALTSTLLTTSIAAASSSSSSSSTALEPTSTSSVAIQQQQRRPRQPITRSPLDIALAMQLRPGLGVGADPAWMVRFLMAMFGWFAILVSGQGEY